LKKCFIQNLGVDSSQPRSRKYSGKDPQRGPSGLHNPGAVHRGTADILREEIQKQIGRVPWQDFGRSHPPAQHLGNVTEHTACTASKNG
jgi:hypothetical protein